MFARSQSFAFATVAVLLCGCGDAVKEPVGQVTGKISLQGAPISEGLIEFSSPSLGSGGQAEINSEGAFKFQSPLPAGSYQVSLQGPVATPEKPFVSKTAIPKKYWMAATSGLELTVVPGPNTFDIELKEAGK